MDWDLLEKNVPPEFITWKRRKFGLFMPTQMSIKHKKIKSNLAKFLGIESETLSKVELWVTDWENAKKTEEKGSIKLSEELNERILEDLEKNLSYKDEAFIEKIYEDISREDLDIEEGIDDFFEEKQRLEEEKQKLEEEIRDYEQKYLDQYYDQLYEQELSELLDFYKETLYE